ncbi:MAG: hypothetical protein ACXVEF_41475 [Polyangiales bacterium]
MAITWAPMLLLAIVERIVKGRPEIASQFAHDFESHVRFLVALPLLIVSDALVGAAFSRCESHLEASGLVASSERGLRAGIDTARRLRASRVAAVIIALGVLGVAISKGSTDVSAWVNLEARRDGATWASAWLGFVGFPVYRFFLLRWMFRWLVWAGFLFWMRRLDLKLVATHPDRSGGLGFLTVPVSATLGLVFGVTLASAVAWRNAVVSHAATIGQVRIQALLLGSVWSVLLLGPLIFFTPRLLRLKRVALVQYSRLGNEYTQAFQDKWIGHHQGEEPLLGTPDLQSLADLGNSMQIVQGLRPTPMDLHVVLPVVAVFAAALLPVALSQLSLEELLMRLVKVVL